MSLKRKLFYTGFFLLVSLGTLLVLSQIQKPQDNRSHAAASTALSLSPANSSKQVGDAIALDVMIDPGTNMISLVKFQIQYDPQKIQLATNPFTINTEAFPIKVEGPAKTTNTLGLTLSVGADSTKVIQKPTKIGTINFTALSGTGGLPTNVTFTNLTQAFSIDPNTTPKENVIQNKNPAAITIGGNSTVTPSIVVDKCPEFCPSITPFPSGTTTVSFDLLLHGVGSAGDNPNPSGNSLSNKNPLHPQRELTVEIYNSANQAIATSSGGINFDAQSGSFKGAIGLSPNIAKGSYSIKVQTPRYLRKRIPGSQKLTPATDNRIAQAPLVAGDTNGDNALDVLDYNAFLDCGYGILNPLPVDDANSLFNKKACKAHSPAQYIDINDDGIVDSTDYNLFLRELSAQSGD